MKNLLESLLGREIEVNCGAALISGIAKRISDTILEIEKDNVTVYINIEKIIAISEPREKKTATPPGFILKTG